MKISASMLGIKENRKENIELLTKTSIDYLHLDIMDGKFVTNYTDIEEIKSVINNNKKIDIHLMVLDVYKYIDEFKYLKPEFITFHYELDCDIISIINYLKKLNIKVGLSICPQTNVEVLNPFLDMIDLVLIMSVNPGLGGQKFIENSISKIDYLDRLRKEKNYTYQIEVDGGINNETINLIKNVDIAVIGSYLTNGNYEENLEKIKEKIYG